ncbi:MAG: hypothetical protein KTR15_07130, partial [Phycisphaeraceae bacterium]|nr:hypothetical protein [Phycisphaeraceae bacterium]
LAGLLVLVGCPGKDEPADEPAEETTQQPAQPEVVSPLELLPDDEDEPAGQAEPAVEIDASAPNAVHRHAGRSAFPEAGESVTQLIAAKRLSDEDQFLEPIDPSDIPDVVPWTEAHKYIGHEITVEGKIVDIGESRDGKVSFLNFHEDWRGKFYMVMFDDLTKTLDTSVEAMFKGKTLRVSGEVEDHRGRPQIKILSLDQVEFVGG